MSNPPSSSEVLASTDRLVGDLLGPDWLGPTCEVIAAEDMPAECQTLLIHTGHMTKVLEDHFGEPVTLRVLADRLDHDLYRRAIVLHRGQSDQVIEFGAVRIHLDLVGADVRDEILNRRAPLGDILIRHEVLRRVEPRAYLRFSPKSPVLLYFRKPELTEAFGRWGTIHTNGAPAIELLEIIAANEKP